MSNTERSFFARPMTWAAGLILLAVLGTLIWLLVNSARGEEPAADVSPVPATSAAPSSEASPSKEPTPEPTATADLPTDSTYDSACGLTGGLTTTPTTSAPAVEWENLNGWYLPVSAEYGPGDHSGDGAWTCYARTPMGAVIAAYTISMRVDGLASNFEDAVTRGTMPGVGQTSMLAKGKTTLGTDTVVPRGFIVDRYTNDEATITFYLTTVQMETTCSIEVAWDQVDTDWKLRPNTNGQSVLGCIQGPPSRFIPWGP